MSDEPSSPKTPAELRAMARHAREVARGQVRGDEIVRRLLEIADQLEAEADALERQKPP
jgi:hypothetical protein